MILFFQFSKSIQKKGKSRCSRVQKRAAKVNSVACGFFDTMFSELMISFITENLFFHRFFRILEMLKAPLKENQLPVRVHVVKQEAGVIISILDIK